MTCPKNPRVTDPTCGMSVAPATAAASAEHEGHTYYFCGKGCAKSFSADPGKYPTSRSPDDLPAGGEGVHPRRAPEPHPIAAQTAGDQPQHTR
jgi:YHS domain-containing protein